MGNCLVTQLKDVVNNDNLEYFRQIKLDIKASSYADAQVKFKFSNKSSEVLKFKSLGGAYLYNGNSGTVLMQEVSFNPNEEKYIKCFNTDFTMLIQNKYDALGKMEIGSPAAFLDLNQLKYCNMNYLNLGTSNTSGNINTFKDNTELTYASFRNTLNIYGDIASLSKATKLTELNISESNITGSIESLIEGWIDNSRGIPDTPIKFNGVLEKCTFGNAPSYVGTGHITWESKTKMSLYKGGNSAADSTVVYIQGYNATHSDFTPVSGFSGEIIAVD